ncbi:hypothetical protein WICPIJ_004518 [Wickerhamomyces pijperi]|uniref:Uncharacterized protein n=1 Tax=Wickerhamomyces pijperi TaxID=599730 RepID=A0A9P8Q7Y3_WICPI|nr:hypothetical protein WICPIJ_004518 [Wickerhamomyces pijperi]
MNRIRPYHERDWLFTIEELNNSPMIINQKNTDPEMAKKNENKLYHKISCLIIKACRRLNVSNSVVPMSHVLLYRIRQCLPLQIQNMTHIAAIVIQISARHMDNRVFSDKLFQVVLQTNQDLFFNNKALNLTPMLIDNKSKEFQAFRDEYGAREKKYIEILSFDFHIADHTTLVHGLGLNKEMSHNIRALFENIVLTQICIVYDLEELVSLTAGLGFILKQYKVEDFPASIHVTSKYLYELALFNETVQYFYNTEGMFIANHSYSASMFGAITKDTITEYFKSIRCSPERELELEKESQKAQEEIDDSYRLYYDNYDPLRPESTWIPKKVEVRSDWGSQQNDEWRDESRYHNEQHNQYHQQYQNQQHHQYQQHNQNQYHNTDRNRRQIAPPTAPAAVSSTTSSSTAPSRKPFSMHHFNGQTTTEPPQVQTPVTSASLGLRSGPTFSTMSSTSDLVKTPIIKKGPPTLSSLVNNRAKAPIPTHQESPGSSSKLKPLDIKNATVSMRLQAMDRDAISQQVRKAFVKLRPYFCVPASVSDKKVHKFTSSVGESIKAKHFNMIKKPQPSLNTVKTSEKDVQDQLTLGMGLEPLTGKKRPQPQNFALPRSKLTRSSHDISTDLIKDNGENNDSSVLEKKDEEGKLQDQPWLQDLSDCSDIEF